MYPNDSPVSRLKCFQIAECLGTSQGTEGIHFTWDFKVGGIVLSDLNEQSMLSATLVQLAR